MPEPSASEARAARLHPAAVPIWWFRDLRFFAVALIPILFGGRLDERWLIAAVLGGINLGAGVVRYARFRYRVGDEGLVVEGGLLGRWRKVLPRARIQSVDVVQKLRHRSFGVVELRVEVIGGGGEAEGSLVALRPEEADRVRAALLGAAPAPVAGVEPRPLVQLGIGDLLLAGITGGGVPVVALIVSQFLDVLPEDLLGNADGRLSDAGAPQWLAILAVALGFVVIVFAISLVMTVLVYWDFTVRREGDRLVITRGLFEKRRAVVPLRRIQAIHLHENAGRRLFGLASLRVSVAGYAGPPQERQEASTLLPIGRRDAALLIATGLLPRPIDLRSITLEPAPARALRRRLVRALLVSGAVTGPLLARFGPAGWWGASSLAVTVAWAILAWRALGHAVSEGYVLARSGVIDRRTSVVPIANVQVLDLSATPLQRLSRLADLRMRIPKSKATAHDLDRARAEERFDQVRAGMIPA